jgi:hypothetical protein
MEVPKIFKHESLKKNLIFCFKKRENMGILKILTGFKEKS